MFFRSLKRISKRKLFLGIICLLLLVSLTMHSTLVFANDDGSVDTFFFGNLKDDGNGCGVFTVLVFILDILTFGVGIAAVIGIAISGVTYMTAKGDEAKTVKAKRRIFEIVIGLAVYSVLWGLANFLLPGGLFNQVTQNSKNQCSAII